MTTIANYVLTLGFIVGFIVGYQIAKFKYRVKEEKQKEA